MTLPTLRLQLALDEPLRELSIINHPGWRLVSQQETIEIKPLVDYDGAPVSEIPVFDRADIYPVPPDPDLTLTYPKEAQAFIAKCVTEAKRQGRQTPDAQRLKERANIELIRRFGVPSDYPRGRVTQEDLLPLLLIRPRFTSREWLQRIHFRAEFFHQDNSLGMFLSACGVDTLTMDEQRHVIEQQRPSANAPAPLPAGQSRRLKVFNFDFTRATIPDGKGGTRVIFIEEEHTKILKCMASADGHRISRIELIKAKVAGSQPEKYFARGALEVLVSAGVVGKDKPTGRPTVYWLKLYLDVARNRPYLKRP